MKSERRQHTRYKVYQDYDDCVTCNYNDASIDVNNISCGGLGVSVDEKMVQGDDIRLQINIPGDGIPVFIVAEVAWTVEDKELEDIYQMGVQFKKVNPCDKERLIKYISSKFFRFER